MYNRNTYNYITIGFNDILEKSCILQYLDINGSTTTALIMTTAMKTKHRIKSHK